MVKRYKKSEYFQYLGPIIHMERLGLSTGGVGLVFGPDPLVSVGRRRDQKLIADINQSSQF